MIATIVKDAAIVNKAGTPIILINGAPKILSGRLNAKLKNIVEPVMAADLEGISCIA